MDGLHGPNMVGENGLEFTCHSVLTRYMANDMQFFLTSPFIIFALWKKPKLGLGLLGLLLTVFTAIPTVLGVVRDWPFSPMLAAGGADIGAYMADFYIVPWCRYRLLLFNGPTKFRLVNCSKINSSHITNILSHIF